MPARVATAIAPVAIRRFAIIDLLLAVGFDHRSQLTTGQDPRCEGLRSTDEKVNIDPVHARPSADAVSVRRATSAAAARSRAAGTSPSTTGSTTSRYALSLGSV